MKYKIKNIPIYGDVPREYVSSLFKISRMTPDHIWKGIKGIYISNNEDTDNTRHYACYGHLDDPDEPLGGGYVLITCMDYQGEKVTYTIDKAEQLPFIFIDAGLIPDEWNFVFNLMHEVGHHNDPKFGIHDHEDEEVYAHRFALQFVTEDVFDRKHHIPYNYIGKALSLEREAETVISILKAEAG
ncbi:hypothetical protein CEW46_31010 [Bacillus cereus]|nr:hypothetical protein CEW46_31010 [Bacillus cereus]